MFTETKMKQTTKMLSAVKHGGSVVMVGAALLHLEQGVLNLCRFILKIKKKSQDYQQILETNELLTLKRVWFASGHGSSNMRKTGTNIRIV